MKMKKQDIILAGMGGGLALGVALALVLEFLSPVMATPSSAERRLGLPVMVSIAAKH
jgi:capsular polysaccharide biosynthesis protein